MKRIRTILSIALLAAFAPALRAQTDWPTYGHDKGGMRYSPLTQITTQNVAKLTPAWTFHMKPASQKTLAGSEGSPLMAGGILYMGTPYDRIVAIEPETGKLIWEYSDGAGGQPGPRRGIEYWAGDKDNPPEILFDFRGKLLALNAKTGKLVEHFGKGGKLDHAGAGSPPIVYKNILITGYQQLAGWDVRTGEKLWEFHQVPQPGEFGNDTWGNDSWKKGVPGTHVWGFMTLDEQRGIVYMPIGMPGEDHTQWWGGWRPGNNLFGCTLVALDATTGKLKWYFQTTHHDLWDTDLAAPPLLMDVVKDGKTIPAVAQVGKTGLVFILDRVTGKPIFGVEERPVPKGDAPDEQYSPTQPFPLKPPPLSRMSYKPEDLVTAADTNEEHAKLCKDLVDKSGGMYNVGPYTPMVYRETNKTTTVHFPGMIGAMDWGGSAFDPKLGYLIVNTSEIAGIGWIEKTAAGAPEPYDMSSIVGSIHGRFWGKPIKFDAEHGNYYDGEKSWPCQKPPWGQLTAVNVNTGDIAWRSVLGVTDELPEGKKNTGRINQGGPMTTASGLTFIGATNDMRFRAFDSKTGKELWVSKMEGNVNCVPITYRGKDGKQYVVITAAGSYSIYDHDHINDEIVAFALP